MKIRTLTWVEMEAVMEYAKALHDGRVEKPAVIDEIDAEIEEAIRQAVVFKINLRMTDHTLVEHVVELMFAKDPAYLEAALGYMPSTAIH
jgi:hypothetical protein